MQDDDSEVTHAVDIFSYFSDKKAFLMCQDLLPSLHRPNTLFGALLRSGEKEEDNKNMERIG